MVRTRARGAARQHRRRTGRGARAPGKAAWRRRRGPSPAGRLRLRRHGRLRAARRAGRTQIHPRRGRHRRRQDARLYRPGQPLGREEPGSGLDQHLHAKPPAPDRYRARPPFPRSGQEREQGGGPQGPRKLSLPAEPRGSGQPPDRPGQGSHRPWPDGALGGQHAGRRHDRRRFSRLAFTTSGICPHPWPCRQARRMHLFVLPPLPQMLHREDGAAREKGRDRRRQPRPGDDPSGARRSR